MKKWKETTRSGAKVRIYAQDGGGRHPIHGAVEGACWIAKVWSANGRFAGDDVNHPDDLLPVRRDIWVNEYSDGFHLSAAYDSLESAKAGAASDSIGTVKFVEVLEESQ